MANIKDVAREAGVSTATVSHVINGTRFVKEQTKDKVVKAMDKLDYHPNYAARSLRSNKSHIVGLLIPDVSNLFYMTMVKGIEKELRKNNYNLIVSDTNGKLANEKSQIKAFNSQLIDGLIMRPVNEDHSFLKNIENCCPRVFVDCKPNNFDEGDMVLSENYKGAKEAINLLIKKGHNKIGIISGLSGLTTSTERLEGYKDALKENNIPLNKNLIKYGDYRINSGYKLMKELIEEDNGLTSVFIANNAMTIGAMKLLKEKNIKIPDDISLIGFDDSDWASITDPPLTVVKQSSFEMGKKAAELILKRINNNEDNKFEEYRLPTSIIERESC